MGELNSGRSRPSAKIEAVQADASGEVVDVTIEAGDAEDMYHPDSVAAIVVNQKSGIKPKTPLSKGKPRQGQGRGKENASTANKGHWAPWFQLRPIQDPRYPDYWKSPPAELKLEGPQCQ